jgi:hypothetical protein
VDEDLNRALSALARAGFDSDRMTAVLERHESVGRIPVTGESTTLGDL